MNATTLKGKAAELLRGALKQASKATLAASLIPLGALETRASQIDSVVMPIGGGHFAYSFTLNFISLASGGVPANIYIPLFDAADVSDIVDPQFWTHEVTTPALAGWVYNTSNDAALAANPGKYGSNPQVFNDPPLVLKWSTDNYISPVVAGFGFTSGYGPLNAPFVVDNGPYYGGSAIVDPPTPGSPARIFAQSPEPSTFILMVMASAGVAGVCRRRDLIID